MLIGSRLEVKTAGSINQKTRMSNSSVSCVTSMTSFTTVRSVGYVNSVACVGSLTRWQQTSPPTPQTSPRQVNFRLFDGHLPAICQPFHRALKASARRLYLQFLQSGGGGAVGVTPLAPRFASSASPRGIFALPLTVARAFDPIATAPVFLPMMFPLPRSGNPRSQSELHLNVLHILMIESDAGAV